MKFQVTGANPKTGSVLTREVDAATADEAEQLANSRGMLVSEVKQIGPSPAPIPYAAPPVTTPAATPDDESDDAPEYTAMLGLASLLTVFAIVGYVVGVIGLFAAIHAATNRNGESDPMTIAVASLGLLMYSLIVHAIGQALRALRDIAINSFR